VLPNLRIFWPPAFLGSLFNRYEHVRRAAKAMNQPMEKAPANIVRAATPSLEKVPEEYRSPV